MVSSDHPRDEPTAAKRRGRGERPSGPLSPRIELTMSEPGPAQCWRFVSFSPYSQWSFVAFGAVPCGEQI